MCQESNKQQAGRIEEVWGGESYILGPDHFLDFSRGKRRKAWDQVWAKSHLWEHLVLFEKWAKWDPEILGDDNKESKLVSWLYDSQLIILCGDKHGGGKKLPPISQTVWSLTKLVSSPEVTALYLLPTLELGPPGVSWGAQAHTQGSGLSQVKQRPQAPLVGARSCVTHTRLLRKVWFWLP